MSAAAALRTVLAALDANGIQHMLTGSFAAAWHGAARATMDVDLVIEAGETQLRTLARQLAGPQTYVSEDAAVEAHRLRSQFNVIDLATGWKIDLIIRKDRPFSRTEFDRRLHVEFEGLPLAVATVEDLVLAKLEWARLGRSARQIEDVASLLRVRGEDLDQAYLQRWIDALGVRAEWDRADRQAQT